MTTKDPSVPKSRKLLPWFALAGCAGVLVIAALGVAAWIALDRLPREDTPERYARLAREVCRELNSADGKPRQLSEAEMLTALDERKVAVAEVQRYGDALAPIAAEDRAILDAALELHGRHEGLAPLAGAAALAALGALSEDEELTRSGTHKGVAAVATLASAVDEGQRLRVRMQKNQIALAKIAPRFSAPVADACLLSGTFQERGLFLGPDDHTLTLAHTFQGALHDCLVYVELIDDDRESAVSIHFVSEWPQGTERVTTFDVETFGIGTPDVIEEVRVKFWAREASSPQLTLQRPLFGW
jgi:hypothetical protein